MKNLLKICIMTMLLFALSGLTQADILEVRQPLSEGIVTMSSGGIFTNIQQAIDAASDGDILEIHTGTYTEQLTITGKGITLKDANDGTVIIEADTVQTGAGNVITINADGYDVTIENLTIRNGDYGIRSSAGNVNVLNCIFYHNGWDGAGLPDPETASLQDFVDFWNTSGHVTDGGAMRIENSAGSEIAYCSIYDNDRGIRFQDGDNGNIHNNVSHENIESGIYLAASSYSGATGCTNTDVNDNDSYENMNNGILSIGGHTNTIRNNDVYDNWTSGIAADYPSEITIQDNTINNNNVYGFTGEGTQGENHGGIFLSGDTAVTSRTFTADILSNTISNNNIGTGTDAEGIRITSSVFSDGIDIQGNTFTNHDIDVLVLSQAANIVINNNSFDGSNIGVQNDDTGGVVDATYNWWGDPTGPSGEGYGSGDAVSINVDFAPWYTNSEMTATPGVHNITKDIWYITIQAAIDDADSGNTIVVQNGTYNETLDIDGMVDLTIQGQTKENTIVKSTSTISWSIPEAPQYDGRTTVVRIYDSNVITFQNMTFDCNDSKGTGGAPGVMCMIGWNSEVTVDNCILKNMSVDDLSGGYYEITSYFRAPAYSDGARAAISFTGNTLIDPGRVGIVLHDYIYGDVSGNTFYKTTDDFGYAIEMGSQSTGQIVGNTIYGYDIPAASDGSESAGIYVENCFTGGSPSVAKDVLVQDNEVYDCQYAMWIGNGYDGFSGDVDVNLTLIDNNFHDNVSGGLIVQDEDAEAGSSITLNGSGNTVVDNNEVGYWIFTQGDGDIAVNLTDETISGQQYGIYVADYASGASTSSYYITVRDTKISGNTEYGVYNDIDTVIVDAELNWWGSSTGPSGEGPGSGDAASQNVDYAPWYCDVAMTSICGYEYTYSRSPSVAQDSSGDYWLAYAVADNATILADYNDNLGDWHSAAEYDTYNVYVKKASSIKDLLSAAPVKVSDGQPEEGNLQRELGIVELAGIMYVFVSTGNTGGYHVYYYYSSDTDGVNWTGPIEATDIGTGVLHVHAAKANLGDGEKIYVSGAMSANEIRTWTFDGTSFSGPYIESGWGGGTGPRLGRTVDIDNVLHIAGAHSSLKSIGVATTADANTQASYNDVVVGSPNGQADITIDKLGDQYLLISAPWDSNDTQWLDLYDSNSLSGPWTKTKLTDPDIGTWNYWPEIVVEGNNAYVFHVSEDGGSGQIVMTTIVECPAGDLDGDCDVDWYDFAILADDWLYGT